MTWRYKGIMSTAAHQLLLLLLLLLQDVCGMPDAAARLCALLSLRTDQLHEGVVQLLELSAKRAVVWSVIMELMDQPADCAADELVANVAQGTSCHGSGAEGESALWRCELLCGASLRSAVPAPGLDSLWLVPGADVGAWNMSFDLRQFLAGVSATAKLIFSIRASPAPLLRQPTCHILLLQSAAVPAPTTAISSGNLLAPSAATKAIREAWCSRPAAPQPSRRPASQLQPPPTKISRAQLTATRQRAAAAIRAEEAARRKAAVAANAKDLAAKQAAAAAVRAHDAAKRQAKAAAAQQPSTCHAAAASARRRVRKAAVSGLSQDVARGGLGRSDGRQGGAASIK